MSEKKKSSFKKVLEDHKQEGKLFRSFTYENFNPLSYLDTIVPELIVVHLLNADYGQGACEEILSELAQAIDGEPWVGACSVFANKILLDRDANIGKLQRQSSFKYFEKSISSFAVFYPQFPLNFLTIEELPSEIWLEKFKAGLSNLYDKRGDEGAAMLGGFLLAAMNQGYKVPSAFLKPDLIRKFTSPGTGESGGSVRAALCAMVGGIFACFRGQGDIQFWSQHFWQHGFEIEPIDWSILTEHPAR